METLFNYLTSFSKEEGIKYFILLCLALAITPYYKFIIKYVKLFILREELKILSFKYSTTPLHYLIENEDNPEVKNNENVLINKTLLNFTWEVKGALKLELLPISKKINGNACSIIIDSTIKKYTLVAYGIMGSKVEAVIDFSDEVFYTIQTNPISTNQKVFRNAPIINSEPYHKSLVLNYKQTKSMLNNLIYWNRNNLNKVHTIAIETDFIVHTNSRKKQLNKQIENNKIMKSYTFSTKKYQSIN